MSLDTIKMFFQNERNKLIGIGVASCLITTAIVAPSAYFGGQPKYKGVIHPTAFNTVSATGEHLADYGELDLVDDGWGNEDNISYVISDDALVRNVIEIKDGIGFQALNVAETQAKEIEKDPDYELNIMNAQFGEIDGEPNYVNPKNNEEANYELVAPINVYMRVPAPVSIFFKDNLMSEVGNVNQPTIWEENWDSTSSSAGIYNQTVNLNNLNNTYALQSYYEWVKKNNYLADLVMAYTFFNWMLFDLAPNGENANYPDAPDEAKNPTYLDGEKGENDVDIFLENVNQMLTNIVGVNEIDQDLYKQANIIHISGTGTASPYIEAELDAFNEFLPKVEKLKDLETDVAPSLTNEGSSTAWYMPDSEINFESKDGETWNLESDSISGTKPPANAFIGTQSRRSYYGSYESDTTDDKSISGMSQWGYGYQSTAATGRNEWNYMEQPSVDDIGGSIKENSFGEPGKYDESYANETPWVFDTDGQLVDTVITDDAAIMDTTTALPLGFTATTDPLVFFTNNDTSFEHKADGKTYKPTGMSPEATKLIFENPSQEPNITWDFLFSNGFIDAKQV